jgi:tetratricopeptide (TPR) repeat protein
MKRSNWRDSLEWKKEGFSFNTTSNEACKLYDASLTQYISLHDDDIGLEKSIELMLSCDPNFVIGRVFKIGIDCINSPSSLKYYEKDIMMVNRIKENERLSQNEKLHVDAINSILKGDILNACNYWDEILIDNPNDLMALKFLYDAYFHLGDHTLERKNLIASILPYWEKSKVPLYEYIYGLYSFSLAEENRFDEATDYAFKSLSRGPYDTWVKNIQYKIISIIIYFLPRLFIQLHMFKIIKIK